jgi:hypothetical protein
MLSVIFCGDSVTFGSMELGNLRVIVAAGGSRVLRGGKCGESASMTGYRWLTGTFNLEMYGFANEMSNINGPAVTRLIRSY